MARNYVDRTATVGDLDMGTIVADVGSQYCRMGFAGDDQPRALFSNVRTKIIHNHNISGFLNVGRRSDKQKGRK